MGDTIKFLGTLLLIVIYIMYTVRYTIVFKSNTLFSKKVKAIHYFMIWAVPFLWIWLLKSIVKSTPGSFEVKTKERSEPFSDAYSAPTD